MKRLKRNPEKFETLDLFTAFSMNYDYKLMVEQDIEDFTQRIKKIA
ncbi:MULTISPECIES: hypothetical protein [Enterobacteriaceae]|nr:hypothetical protein [Klebsiella sp. LTGPAF-6F]